MVFLVILKKVVLKKERTAIWDFTRTNFSHSAEESRNWAIFANTTWKLSARGMPSDIFPHITAETLQEKKGMHCHQCTMCCLYSIFSSQPNEVGHDLTPHNCDIIQHILIPTRSVARKTLLWTFSWASNSKFEIFLELYPCSITTGFWRFLPQSAREWKNQAGAKGSSLSRNIHLWAVFDPPLFYTIMQLIFEINVKKVRKCLLRQNDA